MKASEIKIGERYRVHELPLRVPKQTFVVRVDKYDGEKSYTCTDGASGRTVLIQDVRFECVAHPMNPGQEALDGVRDRAEPNIVAQSDREMERERSWFMSAESLNAIWLRVAWWIVLWQVLSHVGGLLEGVLHWKWVTLLGA